VTSVSVRRGYHFSLINWVPATKIIIGANIALPASILCICRYLAYVASPRLTITTASDKRRRVIFELFMCAGLPIIAMALRMSQLAISRVPTLIDSLQTMLSKDTASISSRTSAVTLCVHFPVPDGPSANDYHE
jgi:hypothetical protein